MAWKIGYSDSLEEHSMEVVETFETKREVSARLKSMPSQIEIRNPDGSLYHLIRRVSISIWQEKAASETKRCYEIQHGEKNNPQFYTVLALSKRGCSSHFSRAVR